MIGYYVHHAGRGHLHHALAVAPLLAGPVTALSSLPRPDAWTADWVQLPRDDDGVAVDPDAGGALHWAPVRHAGLQDRMAMIARWIVSERPRAMVVDLSVEVTVLARLLGVPVASFCLPGLRVDAPHRLAWSLADVIIAPWPARYRHLCVGLDQHLEKVCFTGGISRFDGRAPERRWQDRHGVVLNGLGGGGAVVPPVAGWSWTVLGGRHWCADPWPLLSAADVVVTHAGLGAVADVAAARAAAVIVAQDRPFAEQIHTARALGVDHVAVVGTPAPGDWTRLVDQAVRLGGSAWSAWSDGHGADRAAAAIDAVARGARLGVQSCAS